MNRIFELGNITRDPVVKELDGDAKVCKFGLAVNKKYKTKSGEKKEETMFIDVECWGHTAGFVSQYLTKGNRVLVEGELKQDTWQDNDGNNRSKHIIVARDVQNLSPRVEGGGSQIAAPVPPQAVASGVDGDDEDPF